MGQSPRVLSTDPNAGEPIRGSAGSPRVLSTDPNAGEPLRVASKSRTWADDLGLNHPTDSRMTGFLRGSGSAAVDMLQGATASVVNRLARGGDPRMREITGRPPADQVPDVVRQPESFAGTLGALVPEMAIPGPVVVKGGALALNAIPRVARAGEKFQDVMAAARNIPIDVKDVGDAALRIHQLADRGGSMPMAVRKILNRMTDPNKAAMTYEESRDFASNISRLSANEFQRLTPVVAREVANLRVVLNKANAEAARKAGKLAEYESAMREYAQAMRLREAVDKAVKVTKKVAPWATAAGAATWMTREIRSMLGSE